LQKNKLNSFGDFFKPENTNIRILSMPTVRKDCSAIKIRQMVANKNRWP